MDDFELTRSCISGDKKAWDYFVERFSRLIYDSIRRTFKKYGANLNEDIIDDLHNDVFLALLDNDYRKLQSFEGRNGCSLASFVRTIAVNKTIDYWRRLRPEISIDEQDETSESKRTKFFKELMTFDTHDSLEQEDIDRRVGVLLGELTEEEKQFCQLCFNDGLKPADIANQLGISVDNFYVRKQRLLNRLKKIAQDKNVC